MFQVFQYHPVKIEAGMKKGLGIEFIPNPSIQLKNKIG